MSYLPVIVGFGGINPAGRTSFNHAYRRIIFDSLSAKDQLSTLLSLATLTQHVQYDNGHFKDKSGCHLADDSIGHQLQQQLLQDTLIRKIHPDWFDVNATLQNKTATLHANTTAITFTLRNRDLPKNVPENWQVTPLSNNESRVDINDRLNVILPDTQPTSIQSAGMLPTGFHPEKLYQARNHPRGIQMSVYAASDALRSVGIDYNSLADRLSPDQIAVFASNSIGQLDDAGFGGLTKYPALGKRISSKQMPLGYAQMPADFINAYLIGNVGMTGGSLGACATFLYNLRSGIEEIRSGRRKLVIVGGSDAPITPEIIEGFRAMGALAEEKHLRALDNLDATQEVNYRQSCRPFGNNCGFTIGESSQYLVLMSDDLALQTGATIHAAVADVFIHADGHKKSISAPGIGNYLTLGKAASLVRDLLGEESLRYRSYVQAHGTSTPQNRVTESHVINETAKSFNIPAWTVSAVKAFVGHSQGTAAGDQIMTSLGVWQHGIIPGLTTTPAIANDVHQSHLHFPLQHHAEHQSDRDSVLINAKGFGGNNATGVLLSPDATLNLLRKRYSAAEWATWQRKNEAVQAAAQQYDSQTTKGLTKPQYLYDHDVKTGEDLEMSASEIKIPGYTQPVSLKVENPYKDWM